jgi:hypothetical protein
VDDKVEQVNITFKKLRARLFNLIEAHMSDNKESCDAIKKEVRDFTSQAWNSITKIVEGEE